MIGGSSYGNRSTLIKGEYVDARSIARRHAQHGRVASMETKMPARTYRVSKRNNRLGTKPEAAFCGLPSFARLDPAGPFQTLSEVQGHSGGTKTMPNTAEPCAHGLALARIAGFLVESNNV